MDSSFKKACEKTTNADGTIGLKFRAGRIGTVHETTARNPKCNAYVSAQSHGAEVKVTRHVRKDLADTIAAEVRAASGSDWSYIG